MVDMRWYGFGLLALAGCSGGQVAVEVGSWQDTELRIAEHVGKIVVVDLWAKW